MKLNFDLICLCDQISSMACNALFKRQTLLVERDLEHFETMLDFLSLYLIFNLFVDELADL